MKLEDCQDCPLWEGAHAVPGYGPLTAAVMVVGEAPGYAEEKARTPFIGQGGVTLDILLRPSGSAPEDRGTMIVAERVADHPICGIASRSGFSMINIEKTLMNKEVGFGRRILGVLEEFGINFEHMPTGIDTISLIVKDEELQHHGDAVLAAIQKRCEPDKLSISKDIALIATVGQAMNHHIGVAGRLCVALADAGVNIRVIDQGSSEMNIIVGVHSDDLAVAVNAIYNAFETWD